MALTVEDGTGLGAADSYVTVADIDAYAEARGFTTWIESTDDDAKEAAARRGTAYVDARYAPRWPGRRLRGRDQALAWPRLYVVDSTGETVLSSAVPREVKMATMEASIRELATPGSLTPDYVEAVRVTQETVGPVSVSYSDKGGPSAARPVVTAIDEMLWTLLSGGGSRVFQLLRA